MTDIALRPISEDDMDAIFEQFRDPESVRMAAFTAADPDDREAFDQHIARVLAAPDCRMRAIVVDGTLAGTAGSFVMEGETEVTYWVDRSMWGRGIASGALAKLLELVPERPVFARAASDNGGSLRVLRKAGFEPIGTDVGYANARGGAIEETILRLDA